HALPHRESAARSPGLPVRGSARIEQPIRQRFLRQNPTVNRGSEDAHQEGPLEGGSVRAIHHSGSRSKVLLECSVARAHLVTGTIPADPRRIIAFANRLVSLASRQAEAVHYARQPSSSRGAGC